MFAYPLITRIASTTLESPQGQPVIEHWMPLEGMPATDAEHLIEFAGRTCYESYHRPNPATGTTDKYIARTVHDQHHYSIIEHASVSYFIEGVSRSLLAELTRHRHLSFSVRSQRFIDESRANIILPPAIYNLDPTLKGTDTPGAATRLDALLTNLESVHELAADCYQSIVDLLDRSGLPRKQAREAARAVLPNMTEVKLVVTGNLRAWMEFIAKRDADGADAEIRELARLIHKDLHDYAPSVFPLDGDQQ